MRNLDGDVTQTVLWDVYRRNLIAERAHMDRRQAVANATLLATSVLKWAHKGGSILISDALGAALRECGYAPTPLGLDEALHTEVGR